MALPSGGHLTHGHKMGNKKLSASSHFFESQQYIVNEKTGLIDYEYVEKLTLLHKPKIIVTGFSAYPRTLNFKRFRQIAD